MAELADSGPRENEDLAWLHGLGRIHLTMTPLSGPRRFEDEQNTEDVLSISTAPRDSPPACCQATDCKFWIWEEPANDKPGLKHISSLKYVKPLSVCFGVF